MDWNEISQDWGRFKVSAKRRWDKISEQQFTSIAGRRPLLASRIRDAYGITREDAEGQVMDWQMSLASRAGA